MSVHLTEVTASAVLTVRVPLSAPGSLDDGVAAVVSRLDAVDDVADVTVSGVTPGMNDITVEASVTLTLAVATAREADVVTEEVLTDGVGVQSVEGVEVDGSDPPDRTVTAG